MNRNLELTIILPCLNEAKTLPTCISEAQNFLSSNHVNGKILVANNNSTDNSKNIALGMGAECIDIHKIGYGSAIINSIKIINSKYCIISDCDASYNLSEIMPFLEKLRNGYDLVIGNRFLGKTEKNAMPWLHRYIGTPLISWIGRKIYDNNIKDYNCGLRGFNTNKIKKLELNCNGMEFASEMIVKASKNSLKITEVPINFRKDQRTGKSHLNTWTDGYKHLKLLISNR